MKTSRQINAERKKEGKPPLNFALFRKVIKKLEANPEAYAQGVWGTREPEAPCGTAACIAGWAAHLGGLKTLAQLRRNPYLHEASAEALGITDHEADTLFDGSPAWALGWPKPYNDQWANAATERQQARVAIRYLNHIIKTGKVTH